MRDEEKTKDRRLNRYISKSVEDRIGNGQETFHSEFSFGRHSAEFAAERKRVPPSLLSVHENMES